MFSHGIRTQTRTWRDLTDAVQRPRFPKAQAQSPNPPDAATLSTLWISNHQLENQVTALCPTPSLQRSSFHPEEMAGGTPCLCHPTSSPAPAPHPARSPPCPRLPEGLAGSHRPLTGCLLGPPATSLQHFPLSHSAFPRTAHHRRLPNGRPNSVTQN